MKEGAAPAFLFRHDVGVGSESILVDRNELGVNAITSAILEDVLAECILAHEAGSLQGKLGSHLGQVEQHVVGRTTTALGLAMNIGQVLVLGVNVDHLDLVDDPIAAGKHAASTGLLRVLVHF